MKKSKLLLMLSMFVILMTVFGNVFAQDSDQPAFKVSSIVTDTEMVLSTKNFPADTDFIISMAAEDVPDAYTKVSKFNSRTGGNLNVKVKIGDKFKGLDTIYLMLEDSNGMIYRGMAVNIPEEEPVAEEPVVEEPSDETQISLVNQDEKAEEPAAEESVEQQSVEEPAEEAQAEASVAETAAADSAVTTTVDEPVAEIPVLVCDFSIIPTVSIDSVVRNDSVTFTTAKFPANSTFTVSMGYYVSTWVPERYPLPPHHHDPAPIPPCDPACPPVPHFVDKEHDPHRPAPKPRGYVTTTFSGTPVGTFETGDGAPQTLTFSIPQNLKNVNPIALWISDNGPCGFYSYNYFYNNSTL